MEFFGRKITKKEAAAGAGVSVGEAALVTALALWGDRPITLGISINSKNLCGNDNPTLVKNSGVVMEGLGDAQLRLLSLVETHSGTTLQQAAAREDLKLFAERERDNNGNVDIRELVAADLTCTIHTPNGDHLALSDKAEQMIGQLHAAGIEVNLKNPR